MQVLLLGHAAVVDRDGMHALRSARQATVLALLVGSAGRPVALEHLVDALWGDSPPATARNTLQVHVSALRRLLGPDAIEGGRESYCYRGDPADVDVLRFTELVRRGGEVVDDLPADAARLLRSALSLYRGDLLAGLPAFPALEAERERLRRLHATALMAAIDADLALGRHLFVVDELIQLTAVRPYDEEVVARLMLSFYRAGAQAKALDAYAALARRLRDDLGVAPGPRLRSLHDQVLQHDHELWPAFGRGSRRRVRLERPDGWFVGRDTLLLLLEVDLPADRVHSLVGLAGAGKTRLATELAARCQTAYPNGAVLVPLTGATTAQEIVTRLAGALVTDVETDLATVPAGHEDPLSIVAETRALVVLDDLVTTPAVRTLLDALVARSHCTFVVTSARPSGLRGERIWSVPALDAPAAVDLLLSRARHAGADLADDEETRGAALSCADLVDRLPLAIEHLAPLAVSGLPELLGALARRSCGVAAGLSFTSSLQRLDAGETDLVDLLASARHPVDAELIDAAGLLSCLGPLVRDGLVVRAAPTHGRTLYALVGALAEQVRATRGPDRDRASVVRLTALLVSAGGAPRQYEPIQLANAAQRRLVALEPVLTHALDLARRHGLMVNGADLALHLPELHDALRGCGPPAARSDWLLARDDLEPGRGIDLLVAEATTAVQHNRPEAVRALLEEAVSLGRQSRNAERLAVTLAQLSTSQLLLNDFGVDAETQRETVRLAEGPATQLSSPAPCACSTRRTTAPRA